jgi:hypothetical protein
MMTTETAALDLCSLMGVEELALAGQPTLNRILSDINAELQHLWTLVPQWWSTDTTGEIIRAPQQLAGITATTGSRTITLTGPEAWMAGCTIKFTEEEFQNQILSISGSTATLVRPFAGVTGSGKGATLYQDAWTLAAEVAGVLPPVLVLGEGELIGLNGKRDLRRFSANSTYATHHGLAGNMSAVAENMDTGRPVAYYVESFTDPTTKAVRNRLRIAPLPDKQYVLEYQAKREAPRLAAINNSTLIPVPQNYADSIFLPLLRKRFSTWKNFNVHGMKTLLDEQVGQAMMLLEKLKPQPVAARTVGIRPGW